MSTTSERWKKIAGRGLVVVAAVLAFVLVAVFVIGLVKKSDEDLWTKEEVGALLKERVEKALAKQAQEADRLKAEAVAKAKEADRLKAEAVAKAKDAERLLAENEALKARAAAMSSGAKASAPSQVPEEVTLKMGAPPKLANGRWDGSWDFIWSRGVFCSADRSEERIPPPNLSWPTRWADNDHKVKLPEASPPRWFRPYEDVWRAKNGGDAPKELVAAYEAAKATGGSNPVGKITMKRSN